LCCPGWAQTQNPPASASWVPGLWAWSITFSKTDNLDIKLVIVIQDNKSFTFGVNLFYGTKS
jgi:hypothetical protein